MLAIVQQNLDWLWITAPNWLKEMELLSTEATTTIIVALMGLKITLRSYHQSHSPYMVYEGRQERQSIWSLKGDSPFWRVSLGNVGQGLAFGLQAKAIWKMKGGEVKQGNFMQLITSLKEAGWKQGHDYGLLFISETYAIGSGEKPTLFEVSMEKLRRIEILKIELEYQNIHGDKFSRTINCLPKI